MKNKVVTNVEEFLRRIQIDGRDSEAVARTKLLIMLPFVLFIGFPVEAARAIYPVLSEMLDDIVDAWNHKPIGGDDNGR